MQLILEDSRLLEMGAGCCGRLCPSSYHMRGKQLLIVLSLWDQGSGCSSQLIILGMVKRQILELEMHV